MPTVILHKLPEIFKTIENPSPGKDSVHTTAQLRERLSSEDNKPIKTINIDDFDASSAVSSSVSMSHKVDKGSLSGSSDLWYRKEFSNPAAARREWLAQEFLRLICPNQTETRLAYNPVTNVYYVLSKEVPRFKPLPTNEKENFSNGTYKGLGHLIMGAYFVHEADLKNGNIGLGDDNIVYKIDGDWSFASMRSDTQFPKVSGAIAALQINRLPFPLTYKAHNWLDIFIEGTLATESEIVASDIGHSPQFQQEMFETLFKIALIPDKYFQEFVDAFIPAGAKAYSDFLIDRHRTVLKQAARIDGFAEYLTENKSQLAEMANAFQEQMLDFVVQGESPIIENSKKANMSNHITGQFMALLGIFDLSLDAPVENKNVERTSMTVTGAGFATNDSPSSENNTPSTSLIFEPKTVTIVDTSSATFKVKPSISGFFSKFMVSEIDCKGDLDDKAGITTKIER